MFEKNVGWDGTEGKCSRGVQLATQGAGRVYQEFGFDALDSADVSIPSSPLA